MILFEVVNGYIGESYVRVYVWAEDEATALKMASDAFKKEEAKNFTPRPNVWQKLRIARLFDSDSPAFVTEPSDAGWSPGPEYSGEHTVDNP